MERYRARACASINETVGTEALAASKLCGLMLRSFEAKTSLGKRGRRAERRTR